MSLWQSECLGARLFSLYVYRYLHIEGGGGFSEGINSLAEQQVVDNLPPLNSECTSNMYSYMDIMLDAVDFNDYTV